MRDLTNAQFKKVLARQGMAIQPGGYVSVESTDGYGLNVYRFNAGDNRRAQLAYLIDMRKQWAGTADEAYTGFRMKLERVRK